MQVNPQEVSAEEATTSARRVTLLMLQQRLASICRRHDEAGESADIDLTADINGRVVALDIDNFQVSDDGCIELNLPQEQSARSIDEVMQALADVTSCLTKALTGGEVQARAAGVALTKAGLLLEGHMHKGAV